MAASRFVQIEDKLRPVHFALGAVLVALGFALRWMAAQDQMWLDEIWSLGTALNLGAWHEAFWTRFSDNSHPLNTTWMHLMGPGREPWVYRLEAVMLGTLSIAAAGWAITRDTDRNGAAGLPLRMLCAMLLVAVMYPFVHYGSEARGYAGMMAFVLLAFAAAQDGVGVDFSARWRFALWGTLALLSHLGSIAVMAFIALGYAFAVWGDTRQLDRALAATVRLCAPYALVLGGFVGAVSYDIFVRKNLPQFGNGTEACDGRACFVEALGELARYASGGFDAGQNGLYLGIAAILTIGAIAWLFAIGHRRAVFYATLLILQPLAFWIIAQPTLPYPRYLLGVMIFWPLLAADVLGEMRERARIVRAVVAIALVALVVVNDRAIKRFYDAGRGDYTGAMAMVIDGQREGRVVVGTNMAFQFATVAQHVLSASAPNVALEIVPRPQLSELAPKRLVLVTVPKTFLSPYYCEGEHVYALQGVFAHWGLSGADWGVYTLSDAPVPAAQDCPSVPHSRTRFR